MNKTSNQKKVLALLLIITVAVTSAFAAITLPSNITWDVYGGLTTHQYKLSGFRDVRISDYEIYGNREGSLLLPLSSQNGSGMGFGATIGLRGHITESWELLSDFTATFAGKGGGFYNLTLGAIYDVTEFEAGNYRLHLGAGGKIGYFMYSKNLGRAEILKGTTPPVSFPEGRINNGDPLSYKVYGFNLEPLLDLTMKVTEKIKVGIQLGCHICLPFSSGLSSGKIDIDPKTNPGAYYAPNADKLIRTEFSPKASITGFTGTIYCVYAFDTPGSAAKLTYQPDTAPKETPENSDVIQPDIHSEPQVEILAETESETV